MDITPLTPKGRHIISAYGNGGFVINETSHKSNILILSDRVVSWQVDDWGAATMESLQPLLQMPPEILLIGSGSQFMLLAPNLREWLRSQHIAVDVMDTGAACRTYNVLAGEDRRVAAALIAV